MQIGIDAFHTINMLEQLRFYVGMHWIKYKIYTFTAGEFGSRNKIRVAGE